VFAHYGKWEIRKGIDVLQTAFNRAFTKKDNVKLRLHCWNPFLIKYDQQGNVISDENKTWEDYFKKSPLGDKIEVAPWLPTQVDIANSMRVADVGVFPARAEGWNLELLEMMACGKHVITTNHSGHTEFANKFNSSLIEVPERESAYDGVFFHNQGEWAAFDEDQIEQLVEHMRVAHKKVQVGWEINGEGINTAQRFTWDNAVKKLVEVING
jgi:glycosyltransferase involved in cell wall biosynthesis